MVKGHLPTQPSPGTPPATPSDPPASTGTGEARATGPAHARPASTRTERGKAQKQARILAAADDLFSLQGYEQTTMAQVADRADVAVGTLFQYAASKAELLMMVVMDRWAPRLLTATVPRTVHDPVEAVLHLLQPLVDIAHSQPANAMTISRELLFGAEGEHRADVRHQFDQFEQRIADELAARGHGRSALVTARLIVAGTLVETTRTQTGLSPEVTTGERLRHLVDAAVHGSRPPTLPGADGTPTR